MMGVKDLQFAASCRNSTIDFAIEPMVGVSPKIPLLLRPVTVSNIGEATGLICEAQSHPAGVHV
jgi:hypothetical protein